MIPRAAEAWQGYVSFALPSLIAGLFGGLAAALLLGQDAPDVRRFALAGAFTLLFAELAWIDFRTGLLPDRLTVPGIAFAICAAPLWPGRELWESAAGALALGFGASLVHAFRNGALLGGGDVRMAALGGAVLGVAGAWPFIVISHVSAALCALVVLAARRRGARSEIPFGPFFAIGGTGVLWW